MTHEKSFISPQVTTSWPIFFKHELVEESQMFQEDLSIAFASLQVLNPGSNEIGAQIHL